MEYNSHLWAGASKSVLDFVDRIQSRALKLIGDRVASCILSLEHRRNVNRIIFFYKYNFWKMLVRIRRINTTTPGIRKEYQAVRTMPRLHTSHRTLQGKFM